MSETEKNFTMDALDRKILNELQQNAKQNTKEIASKIGLSVTPTYERIKKLEQKGIIEAYVAVLDRRKIGKHVVGYCQVTLAKHENSLIESFTNEIKSYPEVMECCHVSGNFDFLMKVVADDIHNFHQFLNEKISTIEGISTIHTSFVMNPIRNTTAYPL